MYAAKAAAGGGAPGQVQGQQGVPSSGQGMYSYDTNLDDEDSVTVTINFGKSFICLFRGLHVCWKMNSKAFVAFLLWQDDIKNFLHRNTFIIFWLKLPSSLNILPSLMLLGQYPTVAVAGSPTGVVPTSQHQMPITSQPQPEMYMSGVQMNGGGLGAEYQTGQNVGANVQSQVSVENDLLLSKETV